MQISRRRWARMLVVAASAATMIAGGGVAAVARTPLPAAAPAAFRPLDTLDAVLENGRWKHLALAGSQYSIFTDAQLVEGPASIAGKWPFLPAYFHSDVDAASVVPESSGWKYMFIKGDQRIVFDDRVIYETSTVASKWAFLPSPFNTGFDAVTAVLENGRWKHLGLKGSLYIIFDDRGIYEQNFISTKWGRVIPAQFTSDVDTASVVPEKGGWKYMFTKGNDRVVFNDGRTFEGTTVLGKWPFLQSFLTQ